MKAFSEQALERFFRRKIDDSLATFESLTDREVAVGELIAMGMPNEDIAKALSISPRTGDVHRRNLYSKLGIGTGSGVARFMLFVQLAKEFCDTKNRRPATPPNDAA